MSVSRRTFLKTVSRMGVGAAAVIAARKLVDLEGLGWAGETAPLRTIHLEAREIMWELAPGKRIKAMAYNGQIPGPELRLREGERVRIVLKNSLSEPTTIHWHGVDVPNSMDGVPGITQKP